MGFISSNANKPGVTEQKDQDFLSLRSISTPLLLPGMHFFLSFQASSEYEFEMARQSAHLLKYCRLKKTWNISRCNAEKSLNASIRHTTKCALTGFVKCNLIILVVLTTILVGDFRLSKPLFNPSFNITCLFSNTGIWYFREKSIMYKKRLRHIYNSLLLKTNLSLSNYIS